jgi:hypothetical protein
MPGAADRRRVASSRRNSSNSIFQEDRVMAKAKRIKQLNFMMTDRVGRLSEVTAALAAAKVNIDNICPYGMEGEATFMLTTAGVAKAKKALSKIGAEVKEYDVVSVDLPNRPGELQKVARNLADAGINVMYMYGTSGQARTGTCIFVTSDNAQAVRLINRK